MANTELLDIEASLQALVRQAYQLGRTDALKKIAEAVNSDRPGSDWLALAGPEQEAAKSPHEHETVQETGPVQDSEAAHGNPADVEAEEAHENMSEPEPVVVNHPWWAWKVR